MALDLETVERKLDLPAEKWEGRCFEIAQMLVAHGLVKGTAVFGHFLGPVHPDSMFYGRGLVQHGWVVLPDGVIVDPTRWAFEMVEPYIATIKPIDSRYDQYDEGGQAWREVLLKPAPPFDPDRPTIPLDKHLDPTGRIHVSLLVGKEPPWSVDQVFWVANLPLHRLETWVQDIYLGLKEEGMKGFVPIDNWLMVMEGRYQP